MSTEYDYHKSQYPNFNDVEQFIIMRNSNSNVFTTEVKDEFIVDNPPPGTMTSFDCYINKLKIYIPEFFNPFESLDYNYGSNKFIANNTYWNEIFFVFNKKLNILWMTKVIPTKSLNMLVTKTGNMYHPEYKGEKHLAPITVLDYLKSKINHGYNFTFENADIIDISKLNFENDKLIYDGKIIEFNFINITKI